MKRLIPDGKVLCVNERQAHLMKRSFNAVHHHESGRPILSRRLFVTLMAVAGGSTLLGRGAMGSYGQGIPLAARASSASVHAEAARKAMGAVLGVPAFSQRMTG